MGQAREKKKACPRNDPVGEKTTPPQQLGDHAEGDPKRPFKPSGGSGPGPPRACGRNRRETTEAVKDALIAIWSAAIKAHATIREAETEKGQQGRTREGSKDDHHHRNRPPMADRLQRPRPTSRERSQACTAAHSSYIRGVEAIEESQPHLSAMTAGTASIWNLRPLGANPGAFVRRHSAVAYRGPRFRHPAVGDTFRRRQSGFGSLASTRRALTKPTRVL